VYGCQSKVWCYKDEISKRFTFFTESKLVGGLLHILLVRFQDEKVFNENDFDVFMSQLPFGNKITMQRQTGLESAFKRISHLSSGI
jgi:sulfur transfer protein SufE